MNNDPLTFQDAVVRACDSALGVDTYSVEETHGSPQGSMVTIAMGTLHVRFVCERGQVFAAARDGRRGDNPRWHDLRLLADHVRGVPAKRYAGTETLEQHVRFLATLGDLFAETLGPHYPTAKHDLSERHRLALGGKLEKWLRDHPSD